MRVTNLHTARKRHLIKTRTFLRKIDSYLEKYKFASRDAGTRKGPGGQNLLKGTDKILIMLKSIPWNLEGQLHSYWAKSLPIIFLA